MPLATVNLPQQRKPDQASLIAASNVAFSMLDCCPPTAASFWRMSSVIGSLGFCNLPMMRLIPRKICWIVGLIVELVGRLALVCRERTLER